MESLSVAKSRSSPWGQGDKGSLLDSGKGRGGTGGSSFGSLDSPLATQLQQAWLQTQLPKRDVPKLDYLSPLPSPDYYGRSSPDLYPPQAPFSRSVSSSLSQASPQPFSPADSFSESPHTSHSDVSSASPLTDNNDLGVDSEPMEDDAILTFLSDMLMEEDLAEKKCMYVQCSAYQAMTQELTDLISDTGPPPGEDFHSGSTSTYEGGGYDFDNKDFSANDWVDEVLSSSPPDYSSEEQQLHQQVLQPQPQQQRGFSSSQSSNSINNDASSVPNYGTTNIRTEPSPPLATPVIPRSVSLEDSVEALEKSAAALDLKCAYMENEAISKTDYSNGRSGIQSLEELFPLLMQCAQAVAADDVRRAHVLINELRQKSSPFGDGGHRMTYYFVEALVARLSGTGAQLYTALSSNRPSAHQMLEAFREYVRCNPLPKLAHMFSNWTIYKAALGSSRIHIIDFGILYGVQWPCFLAKLAMRPGGPPAVRITGVDFAQPGFQKNDRVEETGRRLLMKAKQLGVEFEYHAIAGKWENIQPAQFTLRNDETLFVNSTFRLRNLLDETVMASSPRKAVLAKIHSLNPKVFTMGVISSGYNSPFFMARFRESINHFSALFDSIHSSVPPDSEVRGLLEKEVMGREILNVIACEGTERIERAETYRQWQSRSINAGFKQQPMDSCVINKAQTILKEYHKHYGAAQDGNWLLTGWKDRVLYGHTAWTCS